MDAQTSLSIFNFNTLSIRSITIADEPWFVASDIMAALDYSGASNVSKVVAHIPDEWKGVNPIHTPGGVQKVVTLSEHGLYFFLGRSDKPKALPFQKWFAGEVLPAIRKTGKYETTDRRVDLTTRMLVSLVNGEVSYTSHVRKEQKLIDPTYLHEVKRMLLDDVPYEYTQPLIEALQYRVYDRVAALEKAATDFKEPQLVNLRFDMAKREQA